MGDGDGIQKRMNPMDDLNLLRNKTSPKTYMCSHPSLADIASCDSNRPMRLRSKPNPSVDGASEIGIFAPICEPLFASLNFSTSFFCRSCPGE